MSNFEYPDFPMMPIDEVLTKGSDSRPERGRRKKPLTPINCNFDMKCEDCGKAFKTDQDLELHTISHHKEDLKVKVSHYMTEDNKCKKCGSSFKTKNRLITHLGSKHGYINKILVEKAFAVLPCPLNSPQYSASTQRRLVKIKTEMEALDDETEGLDGDQRDKEDEAIKRAGQDIANNNLNE